MNSECIQIRGAQTHNLKNVDLDVPRNKFVVFTGVSGSGKSSLVFDTLYTEAQRQLIETFSSFARRRLPKLSRPPVDEIRNLSTAIIIDQKRMGRTLRSTVGTATEIATYLRMLYSRCGEPFIGPSFYFSFNNPEGMCPECKGLGKRIMIDTALLIDPEKSLQDGAITHPDYKIGGWSWREIVGCGLFDVNRPLREYSTEEMELLLFADGIAIEKRHAAGIYHKNFEGIARRLERNFAGKEEDELPEEEKDVYDRYFIYQECKACGGTRINARARSVVLNGRNIGELVDMELTDLDGFLSTITSPVAESMVRKMRRIIAHLIEIGVGYLSINRRVSTLSGGESQRVKMARQLDCDLVNLMYILDEPSIGLHPRDGARLIDMLRRLRDKGNSVLVVEHDPVVIRAADWVIDVGPQAGAKGGNILYSGTVEGLRASDTLSARYLTSHQTEVHPRKPWTECIPIRNATIHNLKNVSVSIPRGVLTCITGVAGSGKSSLVHEVFCREHPETVVIDQTAPGKSSRSNPATYLGFFDLIRKEIGKATNSDPALFSFNSKGACPKCKGLGYISVEMNFMDDVKMTCDECRGKRFTNQVLALKYQGRDIDEILNMTMVEAEEFFKTPEVRRRLRVLCDVGLDYLEIGQPLSTLSGGEAQRIKLASELHKQGSIYVMDEPTTGLHMADIHRFLGIIRRLVDHDNTVVVIEHNLEVIFRADWVIDMGPEGGTAGGKVLFEGTPEGLMASETSYTGRFLKDFLINRF